MLNKDLHNKGVSSSRIASIVKNQKYRSPYSGPIDAWQSIKGLTADVEGFHVERGNHLESGLISWFEARTGYRVEVKDTARMESVPIVISTPDGVVFDGDRPIAALEIKCPGLHSSFDWGEPPHDYPLYHVPQCYWHMAVLGVEKCYLCGLVGGDLRIYPIRWDQALFDEFCADALEFWDKYIVADEPPPPDGSASYDRYQKSTREDAPESIILANGEQEDVIFEYSALCAKIKAIEGDKKLCEQKIKEMIGENAGISGPWGKVTWKTQQRKTVDYKSIPELKGVNLEPHTKISEYRVFRPSIKEVDHDS